MFSDAILSMIATLLSLFGSHMAERSINRSSMLEDELEETRAELREVRRSVDRLFYILEGYEKPKRKPLIEEE